MNKLLLILLGAFAVSCAPQNEDSEVSLNKESSVEVVVETKQDTDGLYIVLVKSTVWENNQSVSAKVDTLTTISKDLKPVYVSVIGGGKK